MKNRQTEKRKREKGFTLIEVVITLSVIAILAAILVPLISQNINSARIARATGDVSTIGKAIVQFRQDTAQWPIYRGPTVMSLLFSDIDSANDGIPDTGAIPAATDATWNVAANLRLSLDYHLINYNTTVQRGPSTNGLPSWNGPYLSKVSPDPWGNVYVVNSQGLTPGVNGIVYVLSAGPSNSAVIDVTYAGVIPAGSDDIVFRVQ